MSVWVILILVGASFAVAPVLMQLAGGAVAVLMLLYVALSGNTEQGGAFAIIAGGALMFYIGFSWQGHRANHTSTVGGGWFRERIAGAILRGNPFGRLRRWIAFRVAWRLDDWRLDRLLREAGDARGAVASACDESAESGTWTVWVSSRDSPSPPEAGFRSGTCQTRRRLRCQIGRRRTTGY
jgi:hypothetical protein